MKLWSFAHTEETPIGPMDVVGVVAAETASEAITLLHIEFGTVLRDIDLKAEPGPVVVLRRIPSSRELLDARLSLLARKDP